MLIFFSCKKNDTPGPVDNYPADMTKALMQIPIRLTRTTTGYNSLVNDLTLAYAGTNDMLPMCHEPVLGIYTDLSCL